MNNSSLATLVLSISTCLAIFSCEKVQKAREWTCRALTPEEEKAVEEKYRQKRIAIVRKSMTQNNMPQNQLTDDQADQMYQRAALKAAEEQCKTQ